MGESISGRSRELLEAPNFANVATVAKDGAPHVAITWVDVEGDYVLLNSAEGRAWPANLKRDPRLSLTVPDTGNPYEYVEIRGRAVEATHEGAEEHIHRLEQKYRGNERYPLKEGEQRVLFRVEPLRVRHYDG